MQMRRARGQRDDVLMPAVQIGDDHDYLRLVPDEPRGGSPQYLLAELRSGGYLPRGGS
jgi:hypothetical protein